MDQRPVALDTSGMMKTNASVSTWIIIDKTYIPCSSPFHFIVGRRNVQLRSCLMSSQLVLKATLGYTVTHPVLLLFTDSIVNMNVSVQMRTVITLTAVNKPVRQVLLQINHA